MSSNLQTPLYTLLTTPPLSKSPAQQPDPTSNSDDNGDYFFVSNVQAPPPSTATPSVTQRYYPGLLQTPSSPKSQGYFTQRRQSNASRHQKTPSTDNLSTPSQTGLSPKHSPAGSQHSSGGSVHSSNSGHSHCSFSSSEYLTPPRTEDDDERPPYKPRRQSSDSLTLLQQTKRAQSMPQDTGEASKKMKRRRRHKKHCRHKEVIVEEHQNRSYRWLPPGVGSRTATSPRQVGQASRNRGKPGLNTSLPTTPMIPSTDIRERIFPRLASSPAPPVTSRRWSAAATSSQTKSNAAFQSGHTTFNMSRLSLNPVHATLRKLSQQGHNGNRIPAAVAPAIVQAIRERLTSCKLSPPQVPVPASITLRRASGASGTGAAFGVESSSMTVPDDYNRPDEGNSSTHSAQNLAETYLITSKDIDSITELIAAEYQTTRETEIRIDVETPTPPWTSRTTRIPSITSKGVVPIPSSSASSALTTAQAHPSFSKRKPMKNPQKLPMGRHLKGDHARSESQKSMHEIIWQGGGSPSVSDVTDDEGSGDCNFSSLFSEPTTPLSHPNRAPDGTDRTKLKTPEAAAFDPRNAKASIERWSWQCCPIHIAIPPSSDSDIDRQSDGPRNSEGSTLTNRGFRPKKAPTDRVRRQPRSSRSESQLLNVVSFPPLPRRTTSDWFSPLPEIEMAPESHNSKCLYSIGLDITCGPSSCSSQTITPKNSSPTFVRNTAIPKCPSVDFRPYYNHWSKNMVRSSTAPLSGLGASAGKDNTVVEKSTVHVHPKASPQTGLSAETGHFIGVVSDKRRTSSTQSLQRVRTVDHKDKGSRAGTWSQRRPPSICPPPMSTSPSEPVSGDVTPILKRQESEARRSQLLQDRTPPTPKVDHAGIYRQLTGSGKRGALSVCVQDCEPHACDDCAIDPRKPSVDWIG